MKVRDDHVYIAAVSNIGRLLIFKIDELPVLAKGKGNFFEGTDAVSVELYVDNFCRENPLKGISDAMVAMLKELKVPLGR